MNPAISSITGLSGSYHINQKNSDSQVKLFGESEILLGTNENFKSLSFFTDILNGYIFIATSNEKVEYGRLKWYKYSIALLLLIIIGQFFMYNY